MDDDEPPQFVRERSMIISGLASLLLDSDASRYNVLPNIGKLPEFALAGSKTRQKHQFDVNVMADTFNPIGNAGMSLCRQLHQR